MENGKFTVEYTQHGVIAFHANIWAKYRAEHGNVIESIFI